MVKKSTSWAVLIYGAILIILGVYAYTKVDSMVSFYAGVSSGILLILSSCLMFFNIRLGRFIALLLTLILTATFAIRYSVSHKEIPAILSVFSAAMLLFLLARTVEWKK